jgi:ATP-binding cassette, subfamily B, bacterial PglK
LLINALGLIEIVGVGSMLPFLSVAASPDIVETNETLRGIKEFLQIRDSKSFLVIMGFGIAGLFVFQNAFHALVMVVKSRYGHWVGTNLSQRLLGNYLAKPYVFFLNENSATLSTERAGRGSPGGDRLYYTALEGITDIVIGVSIVTFLVSVNPMAALVSRGYHSAGIRRHLFFCKEQAGTPWAGQARCQQAAL